MFNTLATKQSVEKTITALKANGIETYLGARLAS